MPLEAQEGVFEYIHNHGLHCFYSGVSLELDDDTSPWYLNFDHWIPGDSRKIVITSRMVNGMKQDMAEKEGCAGQED